jgi:hypothetical protein
MFARLLSKTPVLAFLFASVGLAAGQAPAQTQPPASQAPAPARPKAGKSFVVQLV